MDNSNYFPSFKNLTRWDDPSEVYYEFRGGMMSPKIHWCFLGEINFYRKFIRDELNVTDRDGKDTRIMFYPETGTLSFSNAKKGHSIAILYAERKMFMDMTKGIRQEHLESCYIFSCDLQTLMEEGKKLKSRDSCFGCEQPKENLKTCAKCKKVRYCSKDCQSKHWKLSHKNLCSQTNALSNLVNLDFQNFDGEWFNFFVLANCKNVQSLNLSHMYK